MSFEEWAEYGILGRLCGALPEQDVLYVTGHAVTPMPWEYEADERPKRKHGWRHAYAGFVERYGVAVGKCPNGMSLERASALLNQGIRFDPVGSSGSWPKRIYILDEDGVLYRAVPTVPGRSYHGFPELPAEFVRLPRFLQEAIWERARELDCEEGLRKWLRG